MDPEARRHMFRHVGTVHLGHEANAKSGFRRTQSGLPLATARTVDVAGCETGIRRRKLHID
jgi:hypothetical protein